MTTLLWLALFWLSFYLPAQSVQVNAYEIIERPGLNHSGGTASANLQTRVITLHTERLDAIGYKPWDEVVYAACSLVHEESHLSTNTRGHEYALPAEWACYQRFAAQSGMTPGIQAFMDNAEYWYFDEFGTQMPKKGQ